MAGQVISKKQAAAPVEKKQSSEAGPAVGADWMQRLLATHPLAWACPWLSMNWRNPRPGVEVREEGDCQVIRVETPGHRLENLEVLANHHYLTIRSLLPQAGEPSTTQAGGAKAAAGNGATCGGEPPAIHAVIPLAEGADQEKISATYSNGLLVVRVPTCRQGRARKIPLNQG